MRQRSYRVVFGAVIALLIIVIYVKFPFSVWSEDFSGNQQAVDREVILRFNPETISVAWQLTQDMLRKEDERFRHIDTKANTLLGMLALAISVVGSGGALFMGQDLFKNSPKSVRVMLAILWMLSCFFLLLSFFFALGATRVVTDPVIGGYHAIPRQAVIGTDRVGQDPVVYQKGLVAEGWEVLAKNARENNRKALSLLRSQAVAFSAAVTVFGIVVLLGLVVLTGPPRQAPAGGTKDRVGGVVL